MCTIRIYNQILLALCKPYSNTALWWNISINSSGAHDRLLRVKINRVHRIRLAILVTTTMPQHLGSGNANLVVTHAQSQIVMRVLRKYYFGFLNLNTSVFIKALLVRECLGVNRSLFCSLACISDSLSLAPNQKEKPNLIDLWILIDPEK